MVGENAETEQHSKCGDGGRRNDHYDSYNMDHKNRGKALIFSHDFFDDASNEPRDGNDKDWQRLEKCLKKLSFSVVVFPNLKHAEIMKRIEQTKEMDHSKNDCLLIAVLTHGSSDACLEARDRCYKADELWCGFTDQQCPTLAGKPKLFIIQACQGKELDEGITLTTNRTKADGSFDGSNDPTASVLCGYKVPFHRDFLLALSSVPGYISWRNPHFGSWFIQELCEELENLTTDTDILTLLTSVSQKVALNYESYNDKEPNKSGKKVVPYFSSLLTRRLVFTKKPDSSLSHMEELSPRSTRRMMRVGSDSSTSSRKKSFFNYFDSCLGY